MRGKVGDRLAVETAAGAVNRVDNLGFDAEFFGGFGECRAGGALVLEFIAQVADLCPGAVLGDFAFDLGSHVLVGFLAARIDLADLHDHRPKAAADRLADFARLD